MWTSSEKSRVEVLLDPMHSCHQWCRTPGEIKLTYTHTRKEVVHGCSVQEWGMGIVELKNKEWGLWR